MSLGDKKGQLNFVQLRPDHKIDYYIFLCYDLFYGKIGKIYWFFLKSDDLYELIPKYGGYSHGTISVLGKINCDNIHGRHCEYSLRPNPTKRKACKSRKLWDLLVEKFNTTPHGIENELNS